MIFLCRVFPLNQSGRGVAATLRLARLRSQSGEMKRSCGGGEGEDREALCVCVYELKVCWRGSACREAIRS